MYMFKQCSILPLANMPTTCLYIYIKDYYRLPTKAINLYLNTSISVVVSNKLCVCLVTSTARYSENICGVFAISGLENWKMMFNNLFWFNRFLSLSINVFCHYTALYLDILFIVFKKQFYTIYLCQILKKSVNW